MNAEAYAMKCEKEAENTKVGSNSEKAGWVAGLRAVVKAVRTPGDLMEKLGAEMAHAELRHAYMTDAMVDVMVKKDMPLEKKRKQWASSPIRAKMEKNETFFSSKALCIMNAMADLKEMKE